MEDDGESPATESESSEESKEKSISDFVFNLEHSNFPHLISGLPSEDEPNPPKSEAEAESKDLKCFTGTAKMQNICHCYSSLGLLGSEYRPPALFFKKHNI